MTGIAASPLDQSSVNVDTGGSTTYTSNATATTTNADDFLFGAVSDNLASAAPAQPGGWTASPTTPKFNASVGGRRDYQAVSATGAYTYTAFQTNSIYAAGIIAFKATGAAVGVPLMPGRISNRNVGPMAQRHSFHRLVVLPGVSEIPPLASIPVYRARAPGRRVGPMAQRYTWRQPTVWSLPTPAAVVTAISPSNLDHGRTVGTGPTVNPSLVPAGLDHGRTLGSPQVNPQVVLVGLDHGRTLGAPHVNPTLNPASLTHTRALGAPLTGSTLLPASLIHTRALGSPQVNGDRITFRGDEVTNENSGICFVLGGSERYGRARGVVVERNRIHHWGRLPVTGHDHGIYFAGAGNARITDNLIYANADWGIRLYPDSDGSYIAYNVIDGNDAGLIFAGEHAGGEYQHDYASDNNTVERNIISNSTVRYNVQSWWGGPTGTGNVARNNCRWNGHLGNTDQGDGGFTEYSNTVADPLYVARLGFDFRLLPCIGKGPRR